MTDPDLTLIGALPGRSGSMACFSAVRSLTAADRSEIGFDDADQRRTRTR